MSDRFAKVQNLIKEQNFDAILISSIPNITYLTNFSNFSKDEREAFLFLVGDYGYIITDGRYSEAVQIHVPHFKLIERSIKNPLEKIFANLAKTLKIRKVGIEEDNLTVNEHKLIRKYYDNTYHYSISALRAIKDQKEIDAIEKACELGDKAFTYILEKIKKGITEKQLAFELEHFIKEQDADISFPPIVAFGKNSSIPHHQTGQKKLENNNIVLLDFGVKLNNYCSDITRTVFFGSANAEFKKMYRVVLEVQQKALEHLSRLTSDGGRLTPLSGGSHDSSEVKSIKAKSVDKIARDYIISKDYPTIPHSLGHGIGLEVHEAPRLSPNSKDELKEGMVFSVEPGIYVPGVGGIRIEDLVVLEKSSPKLLTKSSKQFILTF